MRGHFKKTRFDLYLRESRSRRPKFRSGSEGHLGGSYGPYKLQIPQLTKKRAMIFKIVDGRTDDGHIANAKSHLSVTTSTGETKSHCWPFFKRFGGHLGYGSGKNTDYRTRARYS